MYHWKGFLRVVEDYGKEIPYHRCYLSWFQKSFESSHFEGNDCGLLEGCEVGNLDISIPLLQFANDSLFFLKAKEEYIRVLGCILLIFEAASSLRVNLQKSKTMDVGKIENIDQLASVFGS